jgi:hypothetical protein
LKTILRQKEESKTDELPPLVESLSGCVHLVDGKSDDDIL